MSDAVGKALLDVLLMQDRAEGSVSVAGPIVGEDAADGESEAGGEGTSHEEEEKGRLVGLVGQDGGEADAAVVVDGDVQILVSCATRLPSAVAGDAVAWLDDASQTLDIEVDEAARPLVLVAHDRRWRVKRKQPVHAPPRQGPASRGSGPNPPPGEPP